MQRAKARPHLQVDGALQEAIAMDMDPFLHCVIPNFIQSQNFLEGLQKELLNLDFHEKYNDLYKFQQDTTLSESSFYLPGKPLVSFVG